MAEYYERCQPLLDHTVGETDLLFDSLIEKGIDPDNPRELGAVYLVGGGSAFPAVSRTLRARFRRRCSSRYSHTRPPPSAWRWQRMPGPDDP